jgi:probable HAF family extracellular repeat protein
MRRSYVMLVLLLSYSIPASSERRYVITDLTPNATAGCGAVAINNQGQIVGFVNGLSSGVLWKNGTMKEIGCLPGGRWSTASGINNAGQITGFSYTSSGTQQAIVWENEIMMGLPAPPLPVVSWDFHSSRATDINDLGQVAGIVITKGGIERACLWTNGGGRELGVLPGGLHSSAWALNDLGQVVGNSQFAGVWMEHAVLWDNGGIIDLGLPAGTTYSSPYDINNHGQIVGIARYEDRGPNHFTYGPWRAWVWQNGSIEELPPMPGEQASSASAINNNGQILGYSGGPCIWQNKVPISLTDLLIPKDSVMNLGYLSDMNDRGQIVGVGMISDGPDHAIVLDPVEPICAVVDVEPDSRQNVFNPKQKKPLEVAVANTSELDVTMVNPDSVTFAGASPKSWMYRDIDGDSDADIVFAFEGADLKLTRSITDVELSGSTADGRVFAGTDRIRILGPSR